MLGRVLCAFIAARFADLGTDPANVGGELRPPAIPRSGNARYRPDAEPASRLRHRRPSMRRDGAGAARRRDRDLAIPGAVSDLRAERSAGARRPRPLPRIFERAVRGWLGLWTRPGLKPSPVPSCVLD